MGEWVYSTCVLIARVIYRREKEGPSWLPCRNTRNRAGFRTMAVDIVLHYVVSYGLPLVAYSTYHS